MESQRFAQAFGQSYRCHCAYCVDAQGQLQDFSVRFERMVQWAMREDGDLARDAAEQRTLAYMATMPAWANHPRVKAPQAR